MGFVARYNGARRTTARSRRSPERRPLVVQRKRMLIDRVSRQLLTAPELAPLVRDLDAGSDATLAVAQSARPLVVAALWARSPRPCLVVVPGE